MHFNKMRQLWERQGVRVAERNPNSDEEGSRYRTRSFASHLGSAAASWRGTGHGAKDLCACSFWQFLLRFRFTNHSLLESQGNDSTSSQQGSALGDSGQQVSISGQVASCPSCAGGWVGEGIQFFAKLALPNPPGAHFQGSARLVVLVFTVRFWYQSGEYTLVHIFFSSCFCRHFENVSAGERALFCNVRVQAAGWTITSKLLVLFHE